MLVSSKVIPGSIPGIAYFILIIKAALSQIVVKIYPHIRPLKDLFMKSLQRKFLF